MKGLTYWWAKVQDSIKICFLRDPPTRAQLREQAQTFSNKIKTKYPPRLKQWERKEIGDKTKSKILLSIHWLNLPVFLLSLPTNKRLKRISPIKTLLSHLMIFAVTSTRRFPPHRELPLNPAKHQNQAATPMTHDDT